MFIFEALKGYKSIGAIAPFSDATIEKTISLIQIKHDKSEQLNIVELGSGEGGFTKQLCETFNNSIIHAFEINEQFVAKLSTLFYDNLRIYPISAEFVDKNIQQADIVISTLPFSVFDKQTIKLILLNSRKILKKGGLLIIIQYSDFSVDEINEALGGNPTYTDRSIRNIPPAKIFVYKKAQ